MARASRPPARSRLRAVGAGPHAPVGRCAPPRPQATRRSARGSGAPGGPIHTGGPGPIPVPPWQQPHHASDPRRLLARYRALGRIGGVLVGHQLAQWRVLFAHRLVQRRCDASGLLHRTDAFDTQTRAIRDRSNRRRARGEWRSSSSARRTAASWRVARGGIRIRHDKRFGSSGIATSPRPEAVPAAGRTATTRCHLIAVARGELTAPARHWNLKAG